jgi:hypothetical protein
MDIGIENIGSGGERLPTASTLPKEDADGNHLEIEYGYCKYKDCQTLVLQEMPEKSRVGQLPRSVEVVLENDLVDHAKPGDRILCIGFIFYFLNSLCIILVLFFIIILILCVFKMITCIGLYLNVVILYCIFLIYYA